MAHINYVVRGLRRDPEETWQLCETFCALSVFYYDFIPMCFVRIVDVYINFEIY